MSTDPRQGQIDGAEALQRLGRPPCKHCGGPLTKRQQQSFCSPICRSAWWTARHPRIGLPLTPLADQPAGPIRTRILALMSDGRWYTDLELGTALGVLEGTAGAKRRDLKKPRYGAFRFESRVAARPYSKQAREHRLVLS